MSQLSVWRLLFGYAVSGERRLETFYEHLQPWAGAFMALFGRDRLPARSTLSRYLSALDQAAVEVLRTLFLHDLLARPLVKEEQPGGLWDRQQKHLLVFDMDGTREAARQRALPKTRDRPSPSRHLRPQCAPGYTGRKRGEVVRTRSTVRAALILTNGSAASATLGMVTTGRNCVAHELPLSAICKRITSRRNML